MALTLSTVIASFGPELMEKVTKLQPAASAVGSLNSKVSAIRQDTSDTGGQDSKSTRGRIVKELQIHRKG